MKVTHLSTVHPTFDTRVFHRECRTLVETGHDVALVICHDRDEVIDGIRIRALTRPENRIQRLTRTMWQLWTVARDENADVYHFHDPELIPIGLLLRLFGRKVIYDVHEDVPVQVAQKFWLPAWTRPPVAMLVGMFEKLAGRFMSAVITATPLIASKFPAAKTTVVQNFPILDELVEQSPVGQAKRAANFVYVGMIARIRGIREIINAVDALPDHYGARLQLGGVFNSDDLFEECRNLSGWEKVDFHGWVGRDKMSELLAGAKAGLVVLYPTENYLDSYPVKLFEYMSAGVPAIASDFPLWREIVDGAACGLLVDPMDVDAIAGAMQQIIEGPEAAEAMGRSGQVAARDKYNWPQQSTKLLQVYDGLESDANAS